MHASTHSTTTMICDSELNGRQIHFVGIGGCGMNGLARMAQHFGAVCSGSDPAGGPTITALQQEGIMVTEEQTADTVPYHCDLLVYSAAIRHDQPELAEARRRRIPVLKYAEMLGRLMVDRIGVAIAGTHGKSTTTSILSHILLCANLDPSFIVGARCTQIGGGSRVGHSDILVAEACEYERSFHYLQPTHGLILNIEVDHLDCYSSMDEIVEAFATFAQKIPLHGQLLIHHEMPHRLSVAAGLGCKVETIGFDPQSDWRVQYESRDSTQSRPRACLRHNGDIVVSWNCPMPGEHMAYNAAAAAVIAHHLDVPWPVIRDAIESFQGLDRRMQVIGAIGTHVNTGLATDSINDRSNEVCLTEDAITIVDDYGHHPTEIAATLRALRQHYQPRRLICVFQPHQHSRTRFLMEEFATSFGEADMVIVPEIYFVRDSDTERHAVTATDLVRRLRERGVRAWHLSPFEAIVEHLQVIGAPTDLIVTMGAGDVWKIAQQLLTSLDRTKSPTAIRS